MHRSRRAPTVVGWISIRSPDPAFIQSIILSKRRSMGVPLMSGRVSPSARWRVHLTSTQGIVLAKRGVFLWETDRVALILRSETDPSGSVCCLAQCWQSPARSGLFTE